MPRQTAHLALTLSSMMVVVLSVRPVVGTWSATRMARGLPALSLYRASLAGLPALLAQLPKLNEALAAPDKLTSRFPFTTSTLRFDASEDAQTFSSLLREWLPQLHAGDFAAPATNPEAIRAVQQLYSGSPYLPTQR